MTSAKPNHTSAFYSKAQLKCRAFARLVAALQLLAIGLSATVLPLPIAFATSAGELSTETARSQLNTNKRATRTMVIETRPHFRARDGYQMALINLAMKKTEEKYGPFEVHTTRDMNMQKAVAYALQNVNKGFVLSASYSSNLAKSLAYVPIPIERGLVGYRVCFNSSKIDNDAAEIKSLEDLKKHSFGLGRNWPDLKILRHNGFNVVEFDYAPHKLVASQRFDFYCRGISEFKREYEIYREIPNLSYNRNFLIHYPLPRFFWSHRDNTNVLSRLEEGLRKAYNDNSAIALWHKHFNQSLEFVALENRKIFKLENPDLEQLDSQYKSFLFDPLQQKPAHK